MAKYNIKRTNKARALICLITISMIHNEIIQSMNHIKDRTKCPNEYHYNTILKNKTSYSDKPSTLIFPTKWTSYEISNAFTLSVPNTVELRNKKDIYTQDIKGFKFRSYKIDLNQIVFQQRSLSSVSQEAFNTYCRIMINYEKGSPDEFFKANEYIPLDNEDIRYMQNIAIQGCSATGFKTINTPKVQVVKIGDIYSIELSYVRTGTNGNMTQVYSYLLFNKDETVTITLSYWVKDERLWKKDLQNVIQTFQWNKIKL